MAGIVESMFEGTKYSKNWLRNAAGGAYNAMSGITELPVRGAMAVGQMAQGRSWKDVDTSDNPIARGRKAFGAMTDLPVEQAEPGMRAAFGFGRGAVGAVSAPAAVAAGGINAVAETVAPDNPLVQAAINVATPIAATGAYKGVQQLRRGALRDVGSNVDSSFLSKGQATNKARALAEEDFLAQHIKSADKVARYKQEAATKAQKTLEKFLNPLADAKDASAGLKAAERWKQFETSQLAKHKTLAEKEFKRAYEIGGNVSTRKIKDTLEELYAGVSGSAMSSSDQALAGELRQMIKSLDGMPSVDLAVVQSNLEDLGRAAAGGKSFFDEIAPGKAQGISKKLFSAWQEALEETALGSKPRSAAGAKALQQARENFAVRTNDLKALGDTGISIFMEQGKTGERIFSAPEKVMQKLRSLTPTERDMYVSIMEMTDGTVVDNLRKNILDKVIKNAEVPNASARQPTFSMNKFLTEVDKVKDDLKFLIPNSNEREAFTKTVDEIRQAASRSNARLPNSYGPTQEVGGAVSMLTGSPGAGAISRGMMTTVGDLFTDKNALADLYFGLSKQPSSLSGRWQEVLANASKQGSLEASRPVVAASNAARVMNAQEQPTEAPVVGFGPDDEPQTQSEQPQEEMPDFLKQMIEQDLQQSQQPGDQSNLVTDELLDRISKVESSDNPFAVGPTVKGGRAALGQYQFMPETAKELGIDPFDPDSAREGARTYLSQLAQKYGGDMQKAVAAYNWGPGNVDKLGLDNMPKETREYLRKVFGE